MGACVSIKRRRSQAAARAHPPARSKTTIEGIIRSLQALAKTRRKEETDHGKGVPLGDVVLEQELVFEILSHVPDLELIRSCRLVCKRWKQIVDDDRIWIERAVRRGHEIPEGLTGARALPKHIFRNIAMKDPFGRNFIRNPCGEDRLNGWNHAIFGAMGNFSSTNSYGWTVEDPPQKVSRLSLVPELRNAGYASCFATSHFRCAKDQRIDLYKEGLTKEIMEDLQPDIHVGEWHSASLPHGTTYWLLIEILDFDKNVVEQFRYVYKKSKGVPLLWTKVVYVFPRHRRIRYVRFYHESVITEYLQSNDLPDEYFEGQRGNKMTGATVKLMLPFEDAKETKLRNSADKNLFRLAMGMKKRVDSEESIPITEPEDIFSVNQDEEVLSPNWNLCKWMPVDSLPEDNRKLPEVRYVSLISACGYDKHWVGREHYIE